MGRGWGGSTVPAANCSPAAPGPLRERRAARLSEPCAGPSGGNARSRDAVAVRGLGGAGESGRREFEESYRLRER